MVRIAVFVSGGGTNLQALIDAEKNGIIKSGKITLVISDNENAFALQRAKKAGISTKTVIRNQHPTQSSFENEILKILEDERIDMIILAGFMRILSEDFTGHYENRIINIHPSLIPSFAGKGYFGIHVHEAALKYGVKVTGATVHFVNEIPDGGRIIMQKAVEVKENDTPEVLQKRVMEEAEWIILPQAAEMIAGKLKQTEA